MRVPVVLNKLDKNYALKDRNGRQLFNILDQIPIKSDPPLNSL